MKIFLNQKGVAPILILVAMIGIVAFLSISSSAPFKNNLLSSLFPKEESKAAETWAFEETFNVGAPTAPSQSLLSRKFDYAVTHRNHPSDPESTNGVAFPADHDEDCTFAGDNTKQHNVTSSHRSNGANPDQTFFVCNNHMMSSMGDIEGYSVASFWPRQEFDFTNGGTVEWDVNLNTQSRNWFEVVIMPRNEFQIAPAIITLPIDETYPKDRINLRYGAPTGGRDMHVGNSFPMSGEEGGRNRVNTNSFADEYPTDPAVTDRRIRRKNILKIEENKLTWSIQKQDGTFDDVVLAVPQGLPFHKGLVQFKTHAYTPDKDGVHQRHTHHWDNIRFSGAPQQPYEAFESPDVIALLSDPGTTKTQTINLPRVGTNLFMEGQVMWRVGDQAKLSINGGPNIAVIPHSGAGTDTGDPCFDEGWSTFLIPLTSSQLKVGANTFKWTVGPKPACNTWQWDGFDVKNVEIQMDALTSSTSPTPAPTITPSPSSAPSVAPSATPTPTPSSSPQPSPKPGDIDGNSKVDIFDYNILLTNFGQTGVNNPADLDKNGRVDIFDYNLILTNFGK